MSAPRPAPAILVRRLTPADADAYRELRLRALREHPAAFTSSYEEDVRKPAAAWSQRLAGADDADEWVLGAFDDDTLVGLAGLAREARAKSRHKATVFGMYVAAEATGRGIGRALLAELVARARQRVGLTQLVLTVTRDNDGARELYAAAGFRTFGVEPRAVRVGDAWHDKEHMILFLGDDRRSAGTETV